MSSKRTILITGCSDGTLGSALALQFHKAGWRVFASARTLSKLTLVRDAGIETVLLDTLSDESIQNCVAQVREPTGGSLDALLNNAGAAYSMPLMDVDVAKARELFDLNVWSILNVTRAFLPLLMKSTHECGALLVNHTSGGSVTAGTVPFSGAYSASKAAAASLTETLRLELEPFGVRVVNLMTGSVRSRFFENAPVPVLPSTSLYNVAKDTVEEFMSGAETAKNATDPEEWASQVVGDLSKLNPPHWVWRGKFSTIVRLASHLPVGVLDSSMKKMVGLDVVQREYKRHEAA
ncbi:IBR finger domain protein [Aspergillus pseudodeflectus]|uniref:IBR finger domain protein n=1 Tax=Aspergillus pseudodeflectus TaxID=176178 RepID=A0ABR4JRE6_9EURO